MPQFQFLDDQGVIVADTSDTIQTLQDAFLDEVFEDQSIDVSETSPTGAIIDQEASIISAVMNNNAQVANMLNPNYAFGPFVDSFLSFINQERIPAINAIVTMTMSGTSGTVITSGSQVVDDNGNIWQSSVDYVIDTQGSVSGDFTCQTAGEIYANTGSISKIAQQSSILGWTSVNNNTPSSIGTIGETGPSGDYLAINRYFSIIANQGKTSDQAIISIISTVPGVGSMKYLRNRTAATVTNMGITLLPHSVWVCVDAGSSIDVATALQQASDGCAFNGSQSVDVLANYATEPETISFDYANKISVMMKLEIKLGSSSVSITDIENAVTSAAQQFFKVGKTVDVYEIIDVVKTTYPSISFRLVEIAEYAAANPSWSSFYTPAINEIPQISSSDVQITVVS